MLEKLKINNVALIKSLEIDFSSGFNVVLGETGAGKSIIFDALNFVLGDKADKTLIRFGEDTMKVSAIFSSPNQNVISLLSSYDIPVENEIFISRSYSQSGKSDVKINGEIAPVLLLKQIGELLVDSYGQNEGVALLKQKFHMTLLDSFKPNKDLISDLENLLEKINFLTKEINQLGGNEATRERQIDLLKFQINEIEQAKLKENEDYNINDKLNKISNFEKIADSINNSSQILNCENGVLSLLRETISNLKSVEKYEDKITEILKQLEEGLINLEEVENNLFSLSEEYNLDEKAVNELIERKDVIDNLKRKYGNNIQEIFKYLLKSKEELVFLENSKQMLNDKQNEKNKLMENAQEKLVKLSEFRHKIANELEIKIEQGLKELGIEKARFKVNFTSLAKSIFEVENYNLNCLEDVEFLFSANFGEELKPLAKTISGGELSRFMLVFKNVIATENSSQTLILDEVDSGISGKIAYSVSKKIAMLSKNFQLLCITHLPQVAAMGDCFFLVTKSEKDGRTETGIKKLSKIEIVQEIAKLTYGNYDDKKLDLVNEIISANENFKKSIE